MRFAFALSIAVLCVAPPAIANEPMAPVNEGKSATIARDINGFVLGMPVKDAIQRVKITDEWGDFVKAELDGIEYEFAFCPSGEIYRIESRQVLGNFIPDKAFTDELNAKLLTKYGPSASGTPDSLSWDLVEPVRYSDGNVSLFKTNWFYVMLSGGFGDPISLDMKMLDFRICWKDKVQRNQRPRDEASDKVVF